MTKLLTTIEIETGEGPAVCSIIWLHGLGADGNDFVPIINELKLPRQTAIRFIFPHAPERPVTINGGFMMRAWYDIYHSDFNHRQDEAGIRDSQQAIDALIEREIARGISSKNIFLAGFSQGGAMALQAGLRCVQPLAGIIALSCYLPLVQSLANEIGQQNVSIPILMTHGTLDPVIPIAYAIASREQLLALHLPVEWHQYVMAHTVCEQEIADISNWLRHEIDKRDQNYS